MIGHDADGDFDETEMFESGSVATTLHELSGASEQSEEDKPVHEDSADSSSDSDFDEDAVRSFRTGMRNLQ
jgi:hypothetical protein